MVRVTQPLQSAKASGSLAKTLVFSNNKGRAYARKHTITPNPNTLPQQSARAMLGFLAKQWVNLGPTEQLSWLALATELKQSNYNAYLYFNTTEYSNFYAPSKDHPAYRSTYPGNRTLASAAWDGDRIKLTRTCVTISDPFSHIIFASTTPMFQSSPANTILVFRDFNTDTFVDYWKPPTREPWIFVGRRGSGNGRLWPQSAWKTATPP